jgi:hypothetical protein
MRGRVFPIRSPVGLALNDPNNLGRANARNPDLEKFSNQITRDFDGMTREEFNRKSRKGAL